MSIIGCINAMHDHWQIHKGGDDTHGPCPCCGDISRRVGGVVRHDDVSIAMYSVHWTLNHVATHGAHFDLIVDAWRDDAARIEPCLVSLHYRMVDNRPGFMVIDSDDRFIAKSALVRRPLSPRGYYWRSACAGRVHDLRCYCRSG